MDVAFGFSGCCRCGLPRLAAQAAGERAPKTGEVDGFSQTQNFGMGGVFVHNVRGEYCTKIGSVSAFQELSSEFPLHPSYS